MDEDEYILNITEEIQTGQEDMVRLREIPMERDRLCTSGANSSAWVGM
jgi:hypothetical protein